MNATLIETELLARKLHRQDNDGLAWEQLRLDQQTSWMATAWDAIERHSMPEQPVREPRQQSLGAMS